MITTSTISPRWIVREIWKPLAFYLVWNIAVLALWSALRFTPPDLPLAISGSALLLFLGFNVNAAYARWWEARTLWGTMINASRSFGREIMTLVHASPWPDRERIVETQIAYVHVLRCQLRRLPVDAELRRFLPGADAADALSAANPANALLVGMARRIDDAARADILPATNQMPLILLLREITNAQGGMERIKGTPLPVHYRLLKPLTLLFCLILPFGLINSLGFATPLGSMIAAFIFFVMLETGRDLADPFANRQHDVPMDAMTRTIEIDLRNLLGRPAPSPLAPVGHVLW